MVRCESGKLQGNRELLLVTGANCVEERRRFGLLAPDHIRSTVHSGCVSYMRDSERSGVSPVHSLSVIKSKSCLLYEFADPNLILKKTLNWEIIDTKCIHLWTIGLLTNRSHLLKLTLWKVMYWRDYCSLKESLVAHFFFLSFSSFYKRFTFMIMRPRKRFWFVCCNQWPVYINLCRHRTMLWVGFCLCKFDSV